MRRCCARRWSRARWACRRARLSARRLRRHRRAGRAVRRAARARRHLPHPRPLLRSATAISTRSARRSRSAGAAGGPVHITHFYRRARRTLAAPRHAGARRGGPRRRPRRDVRHLSVRVGGTRLLIRLPPWAQAGGPRPHEERLADPARPRADAPGAGRARRAVVAAGVLDEVRLGAFRAPANPPWRAGRWPSWSRSEAATGRRDRAICCWPKTWDQR